VASLFGIAPQDIAVTLGPYTCAGLTMTQDGDLSAQYGLLPSSPLASQ